jgi:hypothetical protein
MLTGRATRSAERAIRSMFSWGRNKRGVPSGPKYACLGINICSVDARTRNDGPSNLQRRWGSSESTSSLGRG